MENSVQLYDAESVSSDRNRIGSFCGNTVSEGGTRSGSMEQDGGFRFIERVRSRFYQDKAMV